MRSRHQRIPIVLLAAGSLALLLPTCRSTEHTVAKIVTPTPGPVEPEPPPPPPATETPAPPRMTRPVITAAPAVPYEGLIPTARAVTAVITRTATPMPTVAPPTPVPPPTVTPQPTLVPTATPGRRPAGPGGAYYEDEQGNPLATPTP